MSSGTLNIYFQNIGGMRTKLETVLKFTKQSIYDVIVVVETSLNEDFFDAEFCDLDTYSLFRKDRDLCKTNKNKGGGVLIAVRRTLSFFMLICQTLIHY